MFLSSEDDQRSRSPSPRVGQTEPPSLALRGLFAPPKVSKTRLPFLLDRVGRIVVLFHAP
jgi:hypothetical protein